MAPCSLRTGLILLLEVIACLHLLERSCSSVNILEYVAELADQRKLGTNGNQYLGANLYERYQARCSALAVSFAFNVSLHHYYLSSFLLLIISQ